MGCRINNTRMIRNFISLTPHTSYINRIKLEGCLHELQSWFCFNCLSLNANKSECILFSTAQRSRNFNPVSQIHLPNTSISLSDTKKPLSATLDSHSTFNSHIQSITQACYFHFKAFRHIRSSIDPETAKSVACSIIGSRLDYANSILYGLSLSNLAKLQRVTICRRCLYRSSVPS
jgi:hypothetical protein